MKVCLKALWFLKRTLIKYYIHGKKSREKQVISVGGVCFNTPFLELVVWCCKIAYNLVGKTHVVAHKVTAGQETV